MFACQLFDCDQAPVPDGIMCRRHWRVVPIRIQVPIRRMIQTMPVDPRRNHNPTNAWMILRSQAVVAVLKAQGKTDHMDDELRRLALLEKKSGRVRGATKNRPSKRSSRGRPPGAREGN